MSQIRRGPVDCVWPELICNGEGMQWDPYEGNPFSLDEKGWELIGIRYYFDSLIEEGVGE